MKSAMTRLYSRGLLWVAVTGTLAVNATAQGQTSMKLDPSNMSKLGTVDPRYVSYNIDTVAVIGGRAWKPYKSSVGGQETEKPKAPADPNEQVGVNPSLYQNRPSIDLSNLRLQKLAKALGPAYLRVSGTFRNSTYFQNNDNPALQQAPEGFNGVLTRAEWKGVVDFSRAVDAPIVSSVAISPGTRDADGVWNPTQAKEFFDYTKSLGGTIAATEFMNEPNFAIVGGAPKGYDASGFARDAKIFEVFLRKESPDTIFLGPGSVGEGISLVPPGSKMKLIGSEDIMKATGPIFDAFSYHFYGGVSHRCLGTLTVDQALSAEWLNRTDTAEAFYAALRDKYLPGKPLWITETGEAACGGDEFAGQFVDSFRFLNQLGSLAQKNVKVILHQTLVGSDYGLLNEETLEPTPDYWAALLWKRLMGTVVLDPGTPKDQSLRIYAHCMKGKKGGVSVLALNTDTEHEQVLSLPQPAERFTLTAPDLTSNKVLLNGTELQPESDGSIGSLKAAHASPEAIHLEPSSVTFLIIPLAHNQSCM
jgi:hypothetical protein